jgi:hypothetical protein
VTSLETAMQGAFVKEAPKPVTHPKKPRARNFARVVA